MMSKLKQIKRPLPPTLTEARGEPQESERALKQRLPFWAREASCLVCTALMVPLKAKSDTQWGETITWQCHNPNCLAVVVLTTSVGHYLRQGDFDSSIYSWKEIAPLVPKAEEVDIKPYKFEGVAAIPPNPWTRKTNMSVLYEIFWQLYEKNNGTVDRIALKEGAEAVKGKSQNLTDLLDTLPEWTANRTGYAVKLLDGKFQIVGKTVGGQGIQALPYSDPEYKKVHGFEPDEEA